jgi:GNAT superfamily N-acetyltransferase
MRLIEDIKALDTIIDQYHSKGTATNNYLLPSTYKEYLDARKLFILEEDANAFLLVQKEGFYRLYYYLNDFGKPIQTVFDLPCVMEIIYRGEKRKPINEIEYWEKSGFKQHLTRDNMMGSYDKLLLPQDVKGVNIDFANKLEDVSFVKEELEHSLDKYTGDQMNFEDLEASMNDQNILIARVDGEQVGFLRFYVKNSVTWLGHIVVVESYRGRGLAKALVKTYIEKNKIKENSRYSLWVIQNNAGAVNLYKKFGFIYANRSSASLLKL